VVYSKFDVIKHMLSVPILNGRIGKWILALSEFELKFESAKAVKGQVIADFITEHRDPSIDLLEITPWALFFDGSSCGKGDGVGILLISPRGEMFEFAIPIQPTVTNNQAVGDSPRGPLKQLGNPHLNPATKPKHNLLNHAGNSPRRRDSDGPSRRPS
jgi:hypothetical protein